MVDDPIDNSSQYAPRFSITSLYKNTQLSTLTITSLHPGNRDLKARIQIYNKYTLKFVHGCRFDIDQNCSLDLRFDTYDEFSFSIKGITIIKYKLEEQTYNLVCNQITINGVSGCICNNNYKKHSLCPEWQPRKTLTVNSVNELQAGMHGGRPPL